MPRLRARLYVPTFAVLAGSAWLAWYGWVTVDPDDRWPLLRTGELRYVGPVVLGFVAVVFLLEQLFPAEPRALLARGHVTDLLYLVGYAVAVLPVVTLLGAGAAGVLERHAPWLSVPVARGIPHWLFLVFGLLVIDATDWLVHLVNHRLTALWRLHALHHSQEEVSVLTTFRTHPLVHLGFSITAVPGLALAANGATPAALLVGYACLGALPHANLPWRYGRLGRVVISPAYHRLHHRSSGRTDVNLGVLFPFWDQLTRRAVHPVAGSPVVATGLARRPVPVEQAGHGTARTIGRQLAEPFLRARA